jgi:DNA-binding CsgD family transcriptional regulator
MEEHGALVESVAELRVRARRSALELRMRADCGGVWREIVEGSLSVADSFVEADQVFLIVERLPKLHAVRPRNVETLQRVLLADAQKVVSVDLGVSASTVASRAKRELASIGVRTVPSKIPAILFVVARASQGGCGESVACSSEFEASGRRYFALTVVLPRAFAVALSPAIQDVVRLRIEGRTHAEIARIRQTSRRTIANQLATAFHRLGKSGRCGLLDALALQPRNDR